MSVSVPQIANYHIDELIHESDRSLVYRARNIDDGRPAIIKLMRDEYPSFNELVRFRNQYAIAKNLAIQGIVKPHTLERYENRYALIMEDFGGVSLSVKGHQSTPLPFPPYQRETQEGLSPVTSDRIAEFFNIALQLVEILHQLHQNRVIHKDIKPANILIHPETREVRLIDFSISSLLPKETQTIQTPNILEGTLDYISPEQTGRMNRGIDYRSDFYSLGVTFYELLTGELPFVSDDPLELVHAHIAKIPPQPPNPNPQPLIDIVMKLMAKNAEDRYQSALGLKYDLEKCQQQWQEKGKIEPFILGERDRSDRFLIPEKLYGREREVSQLLAAFERVAGGGTSHPSPSPQAELFLVAGYSGVGKTAVVNEVHKPIVEKRGYFIQGKYDQFQRNIPFSAFLQAFRGLMGQLLGEGDEQLQRWQRKILAALGENGRVIIEVIPELETIIGPQPPVPELSGLAAQNRFNLLFEKFVGAIATREHPLVIFLDDLQWADLASLQLIQRLMSSPDSQYLLAIGAYRDNEVFPAHPLMLTLEELKKEGVALQEIILKPLSSSDLDLWLADTLLCGLDYARPLSNLTFQETQGNPFFTSQFLKGLHSEGIITFNPPQSPSKGEETREGWQYDIAGAKAFAGNEDVVAFTMGRLQKLPPETLAALKLAACIGNVFDLEMLAIAAERSPEETATDLWPALREGLLLPQNDTYKLYQESEATQKGFTVPSHRLPHYQFLHDRVQQAAYTLIPAADKPATHLKIGRLLFAKTAPEDREDILFDLVSAFNQGRQLLEDAREKEQLSQLNLLAGRKAKAATAYAAACEYLAEGLALLAEDSWTRQYDLAFALHKERGEAEYLKGDFATAQQWLDRALTSARTPLEKAEIYRLSIVSHTLQANYPQAIATGCQALSLLGIDLPRDDFETVRDEEIALAQQVLESRNIATLAEMPAMTDPEKKMAITLLIAIGPPTYRSHQRLWSVICAKAMNLCLQYGNAPESGYIYPAYGGLRGFALDDYQEARQLVDLSLQVMAQFDSPSGESVAYLMIGSSLRHWSHPLKIATQDYRTSYHIGVESSNLQYAAYAFGHNMYCRFYQGIPLDTLAREFAESSAFVCQQKNKWAIDLLAGGRRIIAQLRDTLSELPETEAEYLDRCAAHKNWQVICIYQILQAYVLLLEERPREALLRAQKAESDIINVAPQGLLPYPQHRLIYGLILAALYPQASADEQARYWQQLQHYFAQMTAWAECCPANFAFARDLLGAEIAKLEGDFVTAIDRYDLAIAAARQQEFWQHVALANELAAKFYLAWDKEKLARSYIIEAYYSYIRWGAIARVKVFEERYASILSPLHPSSGWDGKTHNTQAQERRRTTTRGSSSSGVTSSFLDLETFVKAARAISAEIHLDRLLVMLMQVAVENAGADRGCLLLRQGETWQIFRDANGEESAPLQSLDEIDATNISLRAIDWVRRQQKPLILDDASQHEAFRDDPCIVRGQLKSLLCLPIFYQGELTGLLYLENRLAASVFSSDRVEVLELLCSQAAISLENARLYQQAQQAFTDLQNTQLQLVQNEKMATLGNLVAGVAHEINNPVGFIGGNVGAAQDHLQDLLAILSLYQENTSPPEAIAEEIEDLDPDFIAEDFPKLIASMQKGCDRIANISTSLRTFSRTDTDKKTEFNLHEGLDSTLLILKYRLKANEQRPAIKIIKNYGEIPDVKGYAGQLNQVFMNLLANAIDALNESNQDQTYEEIARQLNYITINTELSENKKSIIVQISDNGIGMPENIKEKIFEQGFTTKKVGKGTGLGMAIARQIVEEKHGGAIACQSELGKGTEFIISLPIS